MTDIAEVMAKALRDCAWGQRKNAQMDVVTVNPDEGSTAILAALEREGYEVVLRHHDTKGGPCPTCGFRIREVPRPAFVYDE